MRLVDERKTTLTAEDTKELVGWIKAGQKRDSLWMDTVSKWRGRLKGVTEGEEKIPRRRSRKEPDEIIVNLAYAHIRTLVPTIFARDPYVDVFPPREEDAANAPVWEAVINGTIARMGFKAQFKKATLDAAVFGYGYLKVGWQGDSGDDGDDASGAPEDPTAQSTATPEDRLTLLTAGLAPLPQNGSGKTKQNESRHFSEIDRNPQPWMKDGGPFMVRVPPTNVIVDPLVADRDPKSARFVAIRYVKPLDEVKATKDYTIPAEFDQTALTIPKGLEHTYFLNDPQVGVGDQRTLAQQVPDSVKLCTIWEVWVSELVGLKLYKQVITLMEGVEKPIRQPVPWADVIGPGQDFPIYSITFNDVPDDYAMSELASWSDMADSVNWLTTKALGNIKRFSRMAEVDVSSLQSEKELSKMKEGADGTFIKVNPANPGQPVIRPVMFPGNSADHYNMLNWLTGTIQLVSGLSENRKGEATARTATEAAIIEGSSKVKLDEKGDIINDAIKEVTYKIVRIIKAFVSRDHVIRMVGTGGAISWLRFGPDNIKDLPDIEIRPDSSRFANREKELQKWQAVFGLAMQVLPLGFPIRLDVILAKFLKALDVENVAEIMGVMSVNPEAEQLSEILMMAAGIPVPPQPNDAHPVHIQTIDKVRGHAMYGQLATQFPMMDRFLTLHEQGHKQFMDQQGAAAGQPTGKTSPLDQQSPTSQIPANQARGQRPAPPEMAQPQPGASNQLAT